MGNRQNYDNIDPEVTDEEMGVVSEVLDSTAVEKEHDLATEEMFDTQHGDGHTFNPSIAQRDGLTYTPPDQEPMDPETRDETRTLPLDSEREPDPTALILEDRATNYDVEMQDRLYRELRHAEASAPYVEALTAHIHNGYVILMGTVPQAQHAAIEAVVRAVPGVEHVESRLHPA